MAMGQVPLVFAREVEEALAAGDPVVGLESNVITHGLEYPHNAATAMKVEEAVRAEGAVPATIGIDAGRILIGMSHDDIERFATGRGIAKVSARDLAVVIAGGGTGATSIAATCVAAELAGIKFVASAGLGGVHRGAERSMDISPDLMQLTRSKLAVVCAGAKSILDLGLTMEYLETQSVPVISYRSDFFPAFYCVSSGIRSPHRIDEETVIAQVIEAHWALGATGSVLITQPISEEDAIGGEEIEAAVTTAMAKANADGVAGQALTKYLMRAVDQVTAGRSAQANMSVLISTARLASRLATAHADYLKESIR
jgi:pseudouridine-5'-phosphate glycosidase